MNNKRHTTISILIAISLIGMSFTAPKSDPTLGQLSSKKYYEKLFSSKTIKKLSKAYKEISVIEDTFTGIEKMLKKAEVFSELKKNAKTKKSKKRANRKEQKILKKAYKANKKANKKYFKNLTFVYESYQTCLNKYQTDNSAEHQKAMQYQKKAEQLYREFVDLANKSESQDNKLKYNSLKSAGNKFKQAVITQEMAIMLFEKDNENNNVAPNDNQNKEDQTTNNKENDTDKPADKTDNKPNDKTNDTNTNNADIVNYNPAQDANVYKSQRAKIFQKLNLSQDDLLLVKKAETKQKRANNLMASVDAKYLEIDKILVQVQKEQDRVKQNMLKQNAEEIEKDIFKNLITSAHLYIDANNIFYKIYNSNFTKARPKNKAGQLSRGLKYEESAKELNLMAKSNIGNADLQTYASEKYLQLMNSLQLQLSAMQEQENAYATYFGWKVTPLKTLLKNRYYAEHFDDPNVDDIPEEIITQINNEYNYAGTYFYTQNNLKPKAYKPVTGTVFKIQIGVFKNLIDAKKFKDFTPISYDIFKNNPYKRFLVGEYSSHDKAKEALSKIHAMGIKDAMIVTYKNGMRQPTAYKHSSNKKKNNTKKKQKSTASKKQKTNKKQSTITEYPEFKNYGTAPYDFAKGKDINKTKGLKYVVQIGVFKIPMTNKQLNNLQPLYQEKSKKGIRYMLGTFNTYQEAKNKRVELKKLGYKDAFISAYLNGKNIPLESAKKSECNKSKCSGKCNKCNSKSCCKNNKPNIYFAVQIGAYAKPLPTAKEKEFKSVCNKHKVYKTKISNGMMLYCMGKFTDYEHAKRLSQKAKIQYPDAFVIAIQNNNKIPVAKAIKMMKNVK